MERTRPGSPPCRHRRAVGTDGAEFVEGTRFQRHEELEARVTRAPIVTFTIQLTVPYGAIARAARVFVLLGEAASSGRTTTRP